MVAIGTYHPVQDFWMQTIILLNPNFILFRQHVVLLYFMLRQLRNWS
jgi:hypothetical protein